MAFIAVGIAVGVGAAVWSMDRAEKVKEQNRQALKNQQRVQEQMKMQMQMETEKQRQMNQAELNKLNRKKIDKKELLDKARKGASSSSSTMLTGTQGVASDELSLVC